MTFKERYKKERADFAEFMKWYPFTLEDLDGEEWADIEGYEGRYQISTFGRVKSFRKKTCRLLVPGLNRTNYLIVRFKVNRKMKYFSVHRLVAKAFIPNPEGKSDVNHIDGCKINAYVGNLEWATRSENVQHAYNTRLIIQPQGEERHNSKLSDGEARYIRDNPENLNTVGLAKMFGITKSTVSKIQLGHSYKTANGEIRLERLSLQGVRNPHAKLTNEQVRYIRDNPENISATALAKKFGLSVSKISDVQTGKTYKNAGGKIRKKIKSRLPDDIRRQIRAEYKRGVWGSGIPSLAKKFNVSQSTISNIINEK